ncbi:MAG: hypothetical protein LBP24_00600 [Coriobacteriales bacterium]|nr:hypothetical protein [Coriobacteriales bacterium]
MLVLCNILVYVSVIGTAVWNDWQEAEAERAEWGAWDFWLTEGVYAERFGLVVVARPEVEGVWSTIDLNADVVDTYKRAEYTMEFPPFEEREWGTIYFVPDPSGNTQKSLDRLNKVIAENDEIVLDEPLSYPITIEHVIYSDEAVKALLVQVASKTGFVLF